MPLHEINIGAEWYGQKNDTVGHEYRLPVLYTIKEYETDMTVLIDQALRNSLCEFV